MPCWTNPDLEVLDWAPPDWLVERWEERVEGLLDWSDVRPLTAYIRFGEEGILHDPADSVLLLPDGRGGGLVLSHRDDPVVRRFDGQDHGLGPVLSREVLFRAPTDGHVIEVPGPEGPTR